MEIGKATARLVNDKEKHTELAVSFETGEEFRFPCEKRDDGNWYVTYAGRGDLEFKPYFTEGWNSVIRAFEGETVLLADEPARNYRRK